MHIKIYVYLLFTVYSDYTLGPYRVRILRNKMESEEFRINITKDPLNICQGNKDFNLTIEPNVLPMNIMACDPSSAQVTIEDNECE